MRPRTLVVLGAVLAAAFWAPWGLVLGPLWSVAPAVAQPRNAPMAQPRNAPVAQARNAPIPPQVHDGQSLTLAGRRIRLWGIQAPAPDQVCRRGGQAYPCGLVSQAVLAALVAGAELRCERGDRDRSGWEVALCYVDGRDLARELVRAGWALDDGRYSNGRYALPQRLAEDERQGLWAGEFDRPWEGPGAQSFRSIP
ncbi:thermonuclease family protein [Arenibaculum pallidiluteum]|uniref:thermonuclease family protein n=1 Tax=Arenibaculum pallidiluteum TaxID=2812559 RepID=UPI001A96A4BF|nr:thermonuclease family protein [Arenibaculum pallidiluteum]